MTRTVRGCFEHSNGGRPRCKASTGWSPKVLEHSRARARLPAANRSGPSAACAASGRGLRPLRGAPIGAFGFANGAPIGASGFANDVRLRASGKFCELLTNAGSGRSFFADGSRNRFCCIAFVHENSFRFRCETRFVRITFPVLRRNSRFRFRFSL